MELGTTSEYLETFRERLGINVAALIGHIAVRHYVMGEDAVEREATLDGIEQMRRISREMRPG